MTEDTTNYRAEDDDLIRRERALEQQRRQVEAMPVPSQEEIINLELYRLDANLRQAATNAVVSAGTFQSFDELMKNSRTLYAFLAGEEDAAGAPETPEDGPTLPA